MAATPPAAHEAMITLAAPTDRRSITAGLLNIGFLPACRQLARSEIGTAVCYLITDNETKGHFRDIIADYSGLCTVGVRGGGQMWQGVKWLCALVAMSCNWVPDVAGIQAAYELEAGNTLHDNSLHVLQSKCHDDGTDKFICEIRFISKGDRERPYFDIVGVAWAGEGWALYSGLCKHTESAGAPSTPRY